MGAFALNIRTLNEHTCNQENSPMMSLNPSHTIAICGVQQVQKVNSNAAA